MTCIRIFWKVLLDTQVFCCSLCNINWYYDDNFSVMNCIIYLYIIDSIYWKLTISENSDLLFFYRYLLIMPTLLKIYSNHQTNKLITTTIEYAVKQFYLMNRKPFILQMFGSVSAMLDTDEEGTYGDAHKVFMKIIIHMTFNLTI